MTSGEQSENHAGMEIIGNGLAPKGYSPEEMIEMARKFHQLGGAPEWLDLREGLTTEEKIDAEDACILILPNCADILLEKEGAAKEIFEELVSLNWDTYYYDVRRQKKLNKRSQYNLCFQTKAREPDIDNKKGRIVSYVDVPKLCEWKTKIEKMCGEEEKEGGLECEGNYYYDSKKCYIGWHGDRERKKVIALNLSDTSFIREIKWRWFQWSKVFGPEFSIELENGDAYIMSEKASGFDWTLRSKKTLRHTAGAAGSKFLQVPKKNL